MLNHCYNKISKTPTGSIIPLHSFAKKDTTKESQTDPIFKKAIKKDTTFVASKK